MKITHVTTRVLSTPADNPLVVGLPAPTERREFVTLELGTDQGLGRTSSRRRLAHRSSGSEFDSSATVSTRTGRPDRSQPGIAGASSTRFC
jgi:hypothetical protein